jgi:hypothetical protein
VVAYVALFLVVAGGSAGALPGRNQVDSGDIRKGQVKGGDLAASAVSSPKVRDDSLTGIDIDEGSLDLPAGPRSLPPSGPAGGDLSGSYPGPQVTESGLDTGGDLEGSLDAAEIAPAAVGDAEIADATATTDLGAWMVDDSRLGIAGAPAEGHTAVGGYPVLLFDGTAEEQVSFVTRAPADATGTVQLSALWSAANPGQLSWLFRLTPIRPDTADTLSKTPSLSGFLIDSTANANELELSPALAGSGIQPGDLLKVTILRSPSGFDDTLAGDAAQHLVSLRFATSR